METLKEEKSVKTLKVTIEGEIYKVNSKGQIYGGPHNLADSNDDWIFVGVSKHHMQNHPVINFKGIWENPGLALHGYLWDIDHGTLRMWAGRYLGTLPRITSIYF